ncbi:MAG TPA: hypothetical protein VHZ03_18870 [Trebonia sp.]|nr:hypothetical protein [Trebonia sp.]
MSAGGRLEDADLTALDAILAALGDWLAGAGPAAREELRACLHRIITWPWPEDMHVAATFCRTVLWQGTTTGGQQ